MNVSNSTATQAALSGVQQADTSRNALQIALLKKVLEAQQQQAQELTRMTEGKGQIIDLRV